MNVEIFWEYFLGYCHSHITLLWIWKMLYSKLDSWEWFLLASFDVQWPTLNQMCSCWPSTQPPNPGFHWHTFVSCPLPNHFGMFACSREFLGCPLCKESCYRQIRLTKYLTHKPTFNPTKISPTFEGTQ